MNMKTTYLILAVAGAIIPYMFFLQYFGVAGFGLSTFVTALFANDAAGGFTADLLLSSFVFWLFVFQQRSRGHGPNPAIFIVLNLLIGLSCALPAYLYAREKTQNFAIEDGKIDIGLD